MASVPPLAFFCVSALAPFPDQLHHVQHRRVPASPALLDALPHTPDPCLWATLAQLVHPLPPRLHDRDLPLLHPDLPLLQKIPDSPNFSLVTLVSLPNCIHVRDDNFAHLRTLHRLLALDLRGCAISSYALTVLARDLSGHGSTRSSLRLLGLHGCPNIDNDVLAVLHKFPLLSAVDLRFTRCTPSAVDTQLSSLGFCPSSNNSLFYPAPLALALYTLEKVAHTTSPPISLYSCPPQSVFRVHIDELHHRPSQPKKTVPVNSSSRTSQTAIRTVLSAEDTVVFIPPLRKQATSASSVTIPVAPAPLLGDQARESNPGSNVASFYARVPPQSKYSKTSILPLFAQAVQSPDGGKLDPLAIARSPPPWTTLDTWKSFVSSNPNDTATCSDFPFDSVGDSQRKQPLSRIDQAQNNPPKVDRARLLKRGSDSITDMVNQFASKRLKVESEFALARTRVAVSTRSHNPFVGSTRSVFAENSAKASDKPPALGGEPDMRLRTCHSLPSETVRPHGPENRTTKPLKPITSLKPPILPKELLPPPRQHALKPKRSLKQTRLSFSRGDGEVSGSWNVR